MEIFPFGEKRVIFSCFPPNSAANGNPSAWSPRRTILSPLLTHHSRILYQPATRERIKYLREAEAAVSASRAAYALNYKEGRQGRIIIISVHIKLIPAFSLIPIIFCNLFYSKASNKCLRYTCSYCTYCVFQFKYSTFFIPSKYFHKCYNLALALYRKKTILIINYSPCPDL